MDYYCCSPSRVPINVARADQLIAQWADIRGFETLQEAELDRVTSITRKIILCANSDGTLYLVGATVVKAQPPQQKEH